jgi:hypothetical protein
MHPGMVWCSSKKSSSTPPQRSETSVSMSVKQIRWPPNSVYVLFTRI